VAFFETYDFRPMLLPTLGDCLDRTPNGVLNAVTNAGYSPAPVDIDDPSLGSLVYSLFGQYYRLIDRRAAVYVEFYRPNDRYYMACVRARAGRVCLYAPHSMIDWSVGDT